jgi:hypothetical protein
MGRLFSFKAGEKMDNTVNLDVSEKARQADITMPVVLAESLAKKLRPNQYLADMGISFDKRIENLFELVRAYLEPTDKGGGTSGRAFTVPLVVVNGPLVREDVFSAVVRLQKNSNGEQTIYISDLREANSDDED